MLGAQVAYERLPYFFSDQYDVGMEYTGHAAEWDEVVIRGDLAAREFVAFWLRDGRVLAGMNVNVWDVTADIQALIRSGAPVDRERLADPAVALAEVLRAAAHEAWIAMFFTTRGSHPIVCVSSALETVSFCVPAREEAGTIARVVRPLMALHEAGVIDQVVVLDDDSLDGTGAIAASLRCGGRAPGGPPGLQFGPVLGKGDADSRALSVLTGDLVCFVDADSEDFGAHFATPGCSAR